MTDNSGTNSSGNTLKLPLWKNVVEQLISGGELDYEKAFPTGWFEHELKCQRGTMQFEMAISEIRKELEQIGFYITSRGQNGACLYIKPARQNVDVVRSYERACRVNAKRGVILGSATRKDALSVEERKRLESVTERLATKLALLTRTAAIIKSVKKNNPELLAP